VIEYLPGTPPPSAAADAGAPQPTSCSSRTEILQDWEDISGQHDASHRPGPAGVTAGTAINYLQEAANKFLTPQFQSIEFGWKDRDRRRSALFVQYVDLPRKIKTVGADMSFDTLELAGDEIAG
jgi:hypothetical protein